MCAAPAEPPVARTLFRSPAQSLAGTQAVSTQAPSARQAVDLPDKPRLQRLLGTLLLDVELAAIACVQRVKFMEPTVLGQTRYYIFGAAPAPNGVCGGYRASARAVLRNKIPYQS